jgi:two-component system chemotaxis response regulator CheY
MGGKISVSTAPGKYTRFQDPAAERERPAGRRCLIGEIEKMSAVPAQHRSGCSSSTTRTSCAVELSAVRNIPQLEVVGSAANGLDALELFCKTDPDVVTMDITMPHMDGIECVERIVAIKPDVLILVISALADKATAVEAMEKGANGFLNKPFSDRQLNDALEELLGSA